MREPRPVLEALRLQIGSDAFSAQYQQSPVPPGGAMVKRSWVRRYTALPDGADRLMVLQSWDMAGKGGPENDWSVCTTWVIARDRCYHLAHVWRGRVDYPALKSTVQRLAAAWQPRRVLIEDASAGTSLIQELRRSIVGVVGVRPERDKVTRMAVASAKIEAGQVLLPERAPWLAELEAELFAFPGSRHDDQCDAISQALNDSHNSALLWANTDWATVLAKVSAPRRLPN